MRQFTSSVMILLVIALYDQIQSAAAWAEDSLDGRYKVTLLVFGEDEFLLLDIKPEDSSLLIEVVDAQQFIGPSPEIKDIQWEDGQLAFTVESPAMKNTFEGRMVTEGEDAGKVLGIYRFRDTDYPASLEKTDEEKVAQLSRSALTVELAKARREEHTPAKVEALQRLLDEFSGPSLHLIYTELLRAATDAEFTAEQVSEYVETWLKDAERFGERWLTQCRSKALRALDGQKAYADLSLQLAKVADASITPETPTDQQAAIVALLARAAELAGDRELAASASLRSEELEAKLDEEYLAAVPPFEPAPFAGRGPTEEDRVVLLELFTGAQCPPCVAADVAFDAVLESYDPSEVVALQYHLHIPGPDPLTSEDSNARQAYYGVRGTPSTYFNGEDLAGGGGSMSGAEGKYAMFRSIINERIAGEAQAEIDLQVTRSGNRLMVNVAAEADEPENSDDSEEADSEEDDADDSESENVAKDNEPQLRLRLALTEESIRYVGGNNLRFHHHVVRAMPGGVEGKELVAGQAQMELTIDLDELRSKQEEYLEEYAQTRDFPKALPPIDLTNLSLVAFVQNDTTKEVLHAVAVEIEDE